MAEHAMNVIEKILVLIESKTQLDGLLVKAARLAHQSGARLELFYCCYSQSLSNSYLFDAEAREHGKLGFIHGVEKWLEEKAQPLLEQGLDVSTDVYWERHLEQGMMTKVQRYEPDMVIKDCRFHHRLDQQLFGHVDWELIRNCRMPLLLARSRDWQTLPRVVAAVDPIHNHEKTGLLDMEILRSAKQTCEWLSGELTLFHSFQPLPTSVIFDDTLLMDYEQFRNKLRSTHQQAMEDLMEQFGLPAETTVTHLAQGEPHQVLPDYLSESGADIVVMGAMERGVMDRFFVGSTSEMALDHIGCDVLIVKESEPTPP